MNHNLLKQNIWKFYVLRIFLRSLVFPVLVVYFLSSGLSATQIGTVFSIGIFAAFLLELPSGYISDKLGHKTTLTMCFLFKAISMLCYLGGTFWWFVIAEILFVGGGALWSGTGEAFLYETLKDLGRLDLFEKIFGRSMIIGLSVGASLLVAMPFVYTYNNQAIFYINAGFILIPLLLSFTLYQPTFTKPVTKVEGWWSVVREWRDIGRFILKQKRYRSIILFYAFWQALQDAIDTFSQIFFVFIKIPTHLFGMIYAVNRILQGIGGQVAYIFRKFMNSVQIIGIFSLELVLFFFVGAFANSFVGIFIFWVRNFFEGVSGPISSKMVNEEITGGNRVTLLSVEPAMTSLIQGILVFILGILFDKFSVSHVFIMLGLVSIFMLSFLYISVAKNLGHIMKV